MKQRVILDTGPLVAALKKRDRFHAWATSVLGTVQPPLLTCESVMTEACFLLRQTYGAQETVMNLVEEGFLQVAFSVQAEANAIAALIARYQSVPMSLADACLVRMAEQLDSSSVMTLDSDFQIYRIHRNQTIALIIPDEV
ncbi:MAG: PIN domain-containing protein [Cyanobacteria bacterium J06626_18]